MIAALFAVPALPAWRAMPRAVRPRPPCPPAARTGLPLRHPALAWIDAELQALVAELAELAVLPAPDGDGARALADRLARHLHFIATRLWPMWRDLTDDVSGVDTAAVPLQRLCAAVDRARTAGDDVALQHLRPLAAPLREQQQRTLVLLRALQAVVPDERLDALGRQWSDTGEGTAAEVRR